MIFNFFNKIPCVPKDVYVTPDGRSVATESYVNRVIQKELNKLKDRKSLTRCSECGRLKVWKRTTPTRLR